MNLTARALGVPPRTAVPLLALVCCLCPPLAIGQNAFVGTTRLNFLRSGHSATLLPGGQVLVAGGGSRSAEVFDPASGTWMTTGSPVAARQDHSATLLPNGKVLVAGGTEGGAYLATVELYNPASGTWSPTASLAAARNQHTATLLPGGKVLVAGGYNGGPLATAELYDPASGTWTPAGALTGGRYGHTATLLASGKVLVAGGSGAIRGAELYDPTSGTWTSAGLLTALYGRSNPTATLLPNGKVLLAGGGAPQRVPDQRRAVRPGERDVGGHGIVPDCAARSHGDAAAQRPGADRGRARQPPGGLGQCSNCTTRRPGRGRPRARLRRRDAPTRRHSCLAATYWSREATASPESWPAPSCTTRRAGRGHLRDRWRARGVSTPRHCCPTGRCWSREVRSDLSSAELYDPASGTWTATGSLGVAR